MDRKIFDKYITEFLAQNSKLNLISKNDEKFLWEKHIYDSLSLSKFFEKFNIAPKGKSLIDIGTGGGFPSYDKGVRCGMDYIQLSDLQFS